MRTQTCPVLIRHPVEVQVTPIDPRDQTWEISQPSYRVYFHDAGGASDEYQISGVDVRTVLAWAEAERRDRTYVVYASVPTDGVGLLRLQGRIRTPERRRTWSRTIDPGHPRGSPRGRRTWQAAAAQGDTALVSSGYGDDSSIDA